MNSYSTRSFVFFVAVCLVCVSPCPADVPVFGDSFKNTAPDHAPGSPVDGAKLERGHGRWKGTTGLYFDDGKVKGGGAAEYARFSFHPEQHQRSARVYIETWLDPGSNGWSGIGFTNGDDGPLPNVGQLWMKIDDRGRIEVRANGASNTLFKDSHTHPAFVEGENLIRIEYNRRLNTARAWLNKVELPLDPLDKNGFVPDIQAVALQLRDNGGNLKGKSAGGAGSGGVYTGLADALIGDQFNVVLPNLQGNHEGDLLNDVATQFGNETWWANSNTGFGPGYATNIDLGPAVALAPFDPADHPGYAESSVEAIVNLGESSWLALGFAGATNWSLAGSGTIWVQLFPSGVVRVRILGTSQILFESQHLDSGVFAGGLPVKLTFNRLTGATQVDFGEAELGIPSINVTVPAASLPLATVSAGFHAARAGDFTATNQFAVDDFAVRLSEEIPPLEITDEPVPQTQVFGGTSTFHCAAGGGVGPYSYRWQVGVLDIPLPVKAIGPGMLTWFDIEPDTPGIAGIDTQDLAIGPVMSAHNGYYRCVATDSNSIPTEVASGSAHLSVTVPLVSDSFSTGGSTGRVSGTPIDGLFSEDGNAVWAANAGATLGDGILTNQVAAAHVLAEVPITPLMLETYRVISVSANLLVDQAEWIGIGFSSSTLQGFFATGTAPLWAQVFADGRVKVWTNGNNAYNLIVPDIDPVSVPVHVRVEYNSDTETPSVFVNNTALALTATPSLSGLDTAGIHAKRGPSFTMASMFEIDDFALTGSESVPPPTFDVFPAGRLAKLGEEVTLTYEVSGGVPPYTFEWSRALETITTDEVHTVTAEGNSTSLTFASFEPSLDGYYQCRVWDSRHGDPGQSSRSVWVYTELPDFGVMWGGRAGENIFIADAYEPGSTQIRAEVLRTDTGPYNLRVDLRSSSAVDSSMSVPLNVWGSCNEAGELPSHPYSLLKATTAPATGGGVTVQFDVPDECLGGARWAILTLLVDVNAEEKPGTYDPFTYPDYIDCGQEHLPEINFGSDNRGQLTAWIPVIDGSYGDLISAITDNNQNTQGFELDFTDPSDHAPNPAGYLIDWVTATVQTNIYHDYLAFHLKTWDPCVYIDDAIPSEGGHTYQPYMAWNTGKQGFVPLGGLTRHRIENAVGSRDNELFLGYKEGTPLTPSVDIEDAESGNPTDPTNAAVMGPDVSPNQGGDSTNLLDWANQLQYHVLVWDNSGDPLSDDGLGFLEQPYFPEGDPETIGNFATWAYLGFVKDGQTTWGNQIPCSMFDLEWYQLDGLYLWGVGGEDPPPPPVDHNALHFVTGDPTLGWTELPDTVLEESEHRVCLMVKTTPTSEPQPSLSEFRFGTACDGSADTFEGNLLSTVFSGGASGVLIHCPLDAQGQPYYHVFSDPGGGCQPVIRGCLPGGDINSGNDCERKPLNLISGCPVPVVELP